MSRAASHTPRAVTSRVIWALMLRESRMAFGTSHWGYLWAILQPSIMLGFLIICFTLIGRPPPFGDSLALFFATSVLCLEYFNKLSNSLMRAFTTNNSLFSYPPVEALDTIAARFLVVSSVHVLVWTGFLSGLTLAGYAHLPTRPELVVAAFAMLAILGLAMGTLNAVLYSLFSSWQHVEKIWGRPLFFLSGTFYVPSLLPPEAVRYLWWNPIIHVVELVRMGFWSNYHSEIYSPFYVPGFAVVILVLALFVERFSRARRR